MDDNPLCSRLGDLERCLPPPPPKMDDDPRSRLGDLERERDSDFLGPFLTSYFVLPLWDLRETTEMFSGSQKPMVSVVSVLVGV